LRPLERSESCAVRLCSWPKLKRKLIFVRGHNGKIIIKLLLNITVLAVSLSLHPSAIHPLRNPFFRPSIHPSVPLSFVFISICFSIHPSISNTYSSIYPSIHSSNSPPIQQTIHPSIQILLDPRMLSCFIYFTFSNDILHATHVIQSLSEGIFSTIFPFVSY